MPDTHFHPDALVRPEGIFERRMVFCPRLQEFLTEDLIVTCEECGDFAIFCCPCSPNSDVQRRSCHKYRLVFTDGACRDNGALGATSGVGLAVGTDSADSLSQLSIPITTKHDRDHKRTSQRAELLGALYGLRFLGLPSRIIEIEGEDPELKDNISCRKTGNPVWVIATDSEYVVKGMTEWLPQWKRNNLLTNRNTVPANLDLFLKIDKEIKIEEAKQGNLRVGFWHVRREHNEIADRLAKKASLKGDPSYQPIRSKCTPGRSVS